MNSSSLDPGVFLTEADAARLHNLPTIKTKIESSLDSAIEYCTKQQNAFLLQRTLDDLQEAKGRIAQWTLASTSIKTLGKMQKKLEEVSALVTLRRESMAKGPPDLLLNKALIVMEADLDSAKLWLRVAVIRHCKETA